jgi:hypothetical protein
MKRTFHIPVASTTPPILAAIAIVLLSWSCNRTIEEEEPRELVEHRIDPCRQWCTAQLDPECGAIIEEQVWRAVEDCAEDCAAVDQVYGWQWARRVDGTDACAEEWIAASDCVVALPCEERRRYFREKTSDPLDDYPCREKFDDKEHCFYTEPSLERVDD